ncbi:hypothetical protein SprV_0301035500 [Sparganum proliferum]
MGILNSLRQRNPSTALDTTHKNEPVSSATAKYIAHVNHTLAIIYVFLFISLCAATSIHEKGFKCRTKVEIFYEVFFCFLYLSSVCIMVSMLSYLYHHRNEAFEAVVKGKKQTRRLLFSLKGEHVNLYLRGGIILFGIMSVIYTISKAYECRGSRDFFTGHLILPIIAIAFFICEVVFVLFMHKLVVLCHTKLFGFCLLHLLTVNLCSWLDASLEKLTTSLMYHVKEIEKQGWVMFPLTAYLLPSVSEFCAINAAVFYELLHRVGKKRLIHVDKHHKSSKQTIWTWIRTNGIVQVTGLSCAAFVLALVFVLELDVIEDRRIRHIVHIAECLTFGIIALGVSFAALRTTRKLKFTANLISEGVDEKLLYITYFAHVIYDSIIIIGLGNAVREMPSSSDEKLLGAFRIILAIVEIVEVTVQTYVIQDSFYRCSERAMEKEKKWGQTYLGCLLVINMSLWMILSFQTKHQDYMVKKNIHLALHKTFLYTVFPMVVLFRFHSTVCLSVSFNGIYQDEVTRFASMLNTLHNAHSRFNIHEHEAGSDAIALTPLSHHGAAAYAALGMHPNSRSQSLVLLPTFIDREGPIEDEEEPNRLANTRRLGVADTTLTEKEAKHIKAMLFTGRRTTLQNMELAQIRLEHQNVAVQLAEKQLAGKKVIRDSAWL